MHIKKQPGIKRIDDYKQILPNKNNIIFKVINSTGIKVISNKANTT